jgi:hypothetical protein
MVPEPPPGTVGRRPGKRNSSSSTSRFSARGWPGLERSPGIGCRCGRLLLLPYSVHDRLASGPVIDARWPQVETRSHAVRPQLTAIR